MRPVDIQSLAMLGMIINGLLPVDPAHHRTLGKKE